MLPNPSPKLSTVARATLGGGLRRGFRWATLLVAVALIGLPAQAADHTVQLGGSLGNVFAPSNLTIQVGDSVTFTNLGGFHNVESDTFRCANGCDDTGGDGSPSSALWSFTRTFNTPGVIDYVCIVHIGIGMVGQLVVQEGGGGDPPGELRFAVANPQVNEGAGTATVTVNRVGGDDGAVSVSYATSDGSANAGADYTASNGTLNWPDGNDDPRTFTVPINDDGADEPNETVNLALSNPTGGATLGTPSTATLTIVDNDTAAGPGTLSFASSQFAGGEAGGPVTITVTRSGGDAGAVSVDFTTSDGSADAGDDYTANNGTLDWADGDTGDRSFDVDLLDDSEVEGDETINLMLSNPTGGANLGTSTATLTVNDDDNAGVGCVPNATTLCLNRDDRFSVQVEWADFEGNRELANALDIDKRDSGLFFFFTEDNLEVLIKVLDACNLPDFESFWVFYAATTNLELTITVTDTVAGVSKVYTNDLGNPAEPVVDTAAFDTCP